MQWTKELPFAEKMALLMEVHRGHVANFEAKGLDNQNSKLYLERWGRREADLNRQYIGPI